MRFSHTSRSLIHHCGVDHHWIGLLDLLSRLYLKMLMLMKNILRGYPQESSNLVLLLFTTASLLSSDYVLEESMSDVNTIYLGANCFELLIITKLNNHCIVLV